MEFKYIKAQFPKATQKIVNDLEAISRGIYESKKHQIIQKGKPEKQAPRVVVAPGTGLGQGVILERVGGIVEVLKSEGGHCDFGPNSLLQEKLYRFMSDKYGHVSYERILSGMGLLDLYEFGTHQVRPLAALDVQMKDHTLGARRTHLLLEAANSKACPSAVLAADLFAEILGAEAGNMFLKLLAHGGVYLAGGLSPAFIQGERVAKCLKSFQGKGRYAPILKAAPLYLVTDTGVGLLGARALAQELL
jgi:glucokinase